jgi:hypothetical protein
MSRQYTYREMDEATKKPNVWAKFTTAELQTKLAELLKLVDSGTLTVRSLDNQFTEIGIIENEVARRDDA